MNDWIFGIWGKHMRLDLCLKKGEKTDKPVHGESTPTPTQITTPQTGIMYQRWKLTVPYRIEPLPSNSGDQFTWSDCASSLTNPATGHHTTFTPSPQVWTRISVRILSLSQAFFSFYGFHGGPAKKQILPQSTYLAVARLWGVPVLWLTPAGDCGTLSALSAAPGAVPWNKRQRVSC